MRNLVPWETIAIFNLLKSLYEKQDKLNMIIDVLGADENAEFLEDEITTVENMIVLSLGGSQDHYEYLSSAEFFWNYRNDEISRSDLITEIKIAIKNDFKGEIPMVIRRD